VSPVQLAAFLAAVVLVASIVSVELGVTVALLELTLGVAAGNVFHLQTQGWLDFIAKFASIVLTFSRGDGGRSGLHASPARTLARARRGLIRRAVRRHLARCVLHPGLEHQGVPNCRNGALDDVAGRGSTRCSSSAG